MEKTRRANLDGCNIEDVVSTGLDDPTALARVPQAPPVVPTVGGSWARLPAAGLVATAARRR